LAAELGLGGCVVFAGAAADDEVARYYRTADVYAMPNREMASGDTEGFGLVFLEAGACGKPVVGGRAGGVPDAVIEGETGYLVDGRSSAEVAAACARLLADGELAARLGANGLARSARTTWKAQAERFLALCEGLCGD
jgi:phosphatidylinositol alpha-1,6-mannosyltransferase